MQPSLLTICGLWSLLLIGAAARADKIVATPLQVLDLEWERLNTDANGKPMKPPLTPMLPAGKTILRSLRLVGRAPLRGNVEVRVMSLLSVGQKEKRLLPVVRCIASGSTAQNGLTLPVSLALPNVTENTTLHMTVTALVAGQTRFHKTLLFVVVPGDKRGTRARYVGRDDTTQGDWVGKYGTQGFSVCLKDGRSGFQLPGLEMLRGSGEEKHGHDSPFEHGTEEQHALHVWEKADSVTDKRVPLYGPGVAQRPPAAFTTQGEPLFLRVLTSDGKPRLLSLYLLDYPRKGFSVDIDLFDSAGHRLDTRTISNYGEGAYIRYYFTGRLTIRIRSRTTERPYLSAWFLDAAPADAFARP
jgi:hypothetical protein